ncbi:MAG: DUF4136 domain-containing protein [Pseudomonadales bacterium]|jgi:hypothetical protein
MTRRPTCGPLGLLLLACAAIALVGCTSKPTGYSDFDAGTDFSGFRTFAFMPKNTLVVSAPAPVNPALESILREEVRAYLTRRGYGYSADADEADFLVGFAVGATPTSRTTSFGDNSNQVRIVGQAVEAETVTQDATTAGLVIDFYDRPSGRKQWMGWTVQEMSMGDRMELRQTVHDAVTIILANFPPEA